VESGGTRRRMFGVGGLLGEKSLSATPPWVARGSAQQLNLVQLYSVRSLCALCSNVKMQLLKNGIPDWLVTLN
jgi:hypothetical protein